MDDKKLRVEIKTHFDREREQYTRSFPGREVQKMIRQKRIDTPKHPVFATLTYAFIIIAIIFFTTTGFKSGHLSRQIDEANRDNKVGQKIEMALTKVARLY